MPPKTSLVPNTDAHNKPFENQRPAQNTHLQYDSTMNEAVPRPNRSLIGTRNMLALLLQPTTATESKPTFKAPLKKPVKSGNALSKSQFSPIVEKAFSPQISSEAIKTTDSNPKKRKGFSLEAPVDTSSSDGLKQTKKAKRVQNQDLVPSYEFSANSQLPSGIEQSTPTKPTTKPRKKKGTSKDVIEPGLSMNYGIPNDMTHSNSAYSSTHAVPPYDAFKPLKTFTGVKPSDSRNYPLLENSEIPQQYGNRPYEDAPATRNSNELHNRPPNFSVPAQNPRSKKVGRPSKMSQMMNAKHLDSTDDSVKGEAVVPNKETKKPKTQSKVSAEDIEGMPIQKPKRGRPRKNTSSNISLTSSDLSSGSKSKARQEAAQQRLLNSLEISFREEALTPKKRPARSPKSAAASPSYKDSVPTRPKSSRRTSYPERGKRILLIGNGFSAKLNPDVSASHYNRWIDQDASPPDRMRQLLIWCFRKKLDEETTETDERKKEILGVAKLIETEILNDLVDGAVSVDWTDTASNRDIQSVPMTAKKIVKTNALNQLNSESIALFTGKLKDLKTEETQWLRAYQAALRPLETMSIDPSKVKERELQSYLRKKPDGATKVKEILQSKLADEMHNALQMAEKSVKEDLEDNADKLMHLLHKLKQSLAVSAKVEQEKLATKVSHLARAFGSRKMSASTKKDVNVRDLLRGISRIDTATSKVH